MDRRTFLKQILATAALPSTAAAESMQPPRILFTGFKRWEGSPETNISEDILLAFQPELEAMGVEIAILDVRYKAVDKFLADLDPDQYDYIVNFGVDTREDSRAITIETQSSNSHYYPDETGYCPLTIEDERGFCKAAKGTVNEPMYASPMLRDLPHAPRFENLDIEHIGRTPQQYLCAYLFYHMTSNIDPEKTENIFVHLGLNDTGDQAKFILGLADEITKAHALRRDNNNDPIMQFDAAPPIIYNELGERSLQF